METKISKRDMINIFKRRGHDIINANVTKASNNATVAVYWANPLFSKLTKDWYLILNDKDSRKLILFIIPAFSIDVNELCPREDKWINLKIAYDNNYIDVPSGYSFAKFKADETNY